ncbi:MAG: band 7 protein [Gemmatimonadetes bacterium]|nr:band 7 protein [Gemmatimonadota bacterium]
MTAGPPPIPQMAYFIAESGKPVGPLDRTALEQRVREGKLRGDTLVWRDGMANWLPASQVSELKDVLGD